MKAINITKQTHHQVDDAELSVIERTAYLEGKQGYPTAPIESLSQGLSGRYRGCYQMGYNTAEWEDKYEL